MIDDKNLSILTEMLEKSIYRGDEKKTSSLAISSSGEMYKAANFESDTHLMDIPSELAVLAFAAASNDFKVNKVITLMNTPSGAANLSPVSTKIIVDYASRVDKKVAYEIVNKDGKIIYSVADVRETLPLYTPKDMVLDKTKTEPASPNLRKIDEVTENFSGKSIPTILKEYAKIGVARNFPTANKASGYGTAILTKKGNIYFGGQYSPFDGQLGIHSEMVTCMRAIMNDDDQITDLGLVSTKHTDKPCNCCGICRQFIAEISEKYNLQIKIHCFAFENESSQEHEIESYLPSQWSNKA